MSTGVSVRHNFETAHRLPHLGKDSKCFNLHGHSWWTEITVVTESVDARGMVVEFGEFKHEVRDFIDHYFDHGTILGREDPLLPILRSEGCKVYQFDEWPTVEAVAWELFHAAERILVNVPHAAGAYVLRTLVRETAVNSAMAGEW